MGASCTPQRRWVDAGGFGAAAVSWRSVRLGARSGALRRGSSIALALLVFAATATSVQASDDVGGQGGQLYSIERRHLMGTHELSASIGTLPMDAFGKGITLQGAYTYHFSPLMGWEILSGSYSFIVSTKLREDLRERFEAEAEEEGELIGILSSNVTFKPLYGKIAWLNDTLLSAELFFVAGPAIGFFDDESRPLGPNVGVGLRLFIGRHFSVRLDIRDYVFIADFSDVRNHLYVSLGGSLTFGFDEPTLEE